MIINRLSFPDFFMETMLPSLRAVIANKFKAKKKMIPDLFQVMNSDGSIEQFSGFSGLGYASEVSELGDIREDAPVQEFASTFVHRTFALALSFSRETVEDDKHRLIRRSTEELADSVVETTEIDGANVINLGFSTAGYDGQPLFSANHPQSKRGGVQSNILSVAADLSVSSLQSALIDWMTMRRSNGHLVSLPTPRLLVSANGHFNAHEILKGTYRSDTANNTVNAFRYGEQGPIESIMSWARITNPKFWGLFAPPGQTGLVWFWRVKPYQYPFRDDKSQRAGVAIRYRKSQGWESYLGTYASPGAS